MGCLPLFSLLVVVIVVVHEYQTVADLVDDVLFFEMSVGYDLTHESSKSVQKIHSDFPDALCAVC